MELDEIFYLRLLNFIKLDGFKLIKEINVEI